MAAAFHVSLLSRQLELLRARFLQRHPHAWLVWEPSASAAPAEPEQPKGPLAPRSLRPKADDGLCFELAPPAEGGVLLLGRNETSNVIIPDATVSRQHLALSFDAAWSVQSVSQGGFSYLQGAKMESDQWYPLESGNKVRLGDVELTFLSPEDLVQRLTPEPVDSAPE